MDGLEQIKLEREIKEEIQQLGDDLTQEELQRYDEVQEEFGAKHPAEIDIWETVWDTYNRPYDTGIPETALTSATAQALGMRKSKAKKAVDIAKEFDKLIEDKPAEQVEFDTDNETVLRPPLPEERPDLYYDGVEEFSSRDVWESLWDEMNKSEDATTVEGILKRFCEKIFDCESDAEIAAIIAVGEMAGAIEKEGNKYRLSTDRPDSFWVGVWDNTELGVDTCIKRDTIIPAIMLESDCSHQEAKERFERGVDNGEIYSPENKPDNQYRINDPSSDEGPEITTDNNEDGGDGGGEYSADSALHVYKQLSEPSEWRKRWSISSISPSRSRSGCSRTHANML